MEEKEIEKKYNCNVILCGPAVGKTYLASIDNRFIDIDHERAKYKYNLYSKNDVEFESTKADRGKTINKDYNEFTIKLLKKTIKENKIALISYQKEILDYILDNNIKYCLVYADLSARNEYIKRMKNRGNNDKFISEMTNIESWNKFYINNECDNKATYKIKLKNNEYLSDYKDYFIH